MILLAPSRHAFAMGNAAHHHHVANAEGKIARRLLQDDGDAKCAASRGPTRPEIDAVKTRQTLLRPDVTRDRGIAAVSDFTRPVRTDDCLADHRL